MDKETEKEQRNALKLLQDDGPKFYIPTIDKDPDISDCEIIQLPIDEENDFFMHPNNIREQLKETHNDL